MCFTARCMEEGGARARPLVNGVVSKKATRAGRTALFLTAAAAQRKGRAAGEQNCGAGRGKRERRGGQRRERSFEKGGGGGAAQKEKERIERGEREAASGGGDGKAVCLARAVAGPF